MIVSLACSAAHAVPVFTNSNFQSTTTTTTFAYGVPITGWTDVSGGGSATGVAARYAPGLWDNGVAPNGLTNVAFLQNEGAALQQSVSGFTAGDVYQITIVADARYATSGQNGQSGGPVSLGIAVNGTEAGAANLSPSAVTAVDPNGTYATPWITYTSAQFRATGANETVRFSNLGIPGSAPFDDVSVDIAAASLTDLTTASSVPEPASLALVSGFVLTAVARHRRRRD